MASSTEIEKKNPEIQMEPQNTPNRQSNSEEEERLRGITISDFKCY